MASQPIYGAHVSQTEGRTLELILTKDIIGGICGPCSEPVKVSGSTEDVDAHLAQMGYTRTSPWQIVTSYAGMQLEALIQPV